MLDFQVDCGGAGFVTAGVWPPPANMLNESLIVNEIKRNVNGGIQTHPIKHMCTVNLYGEETAHNPQILTEAHL